MYYLAEVQEKVFRSTDIQLWELGVVLQQDFLELSRKLDIQIREFFKRDIYEIRPKHFGSDENCSETLMNSRLVKTRLRTEIDSIKSIYL